MKRESWSSSLGVILAVAGSAVGLGNFLRFPGQVAQNGGGAFMIPYFIALLVIGLPIAWLEWNIGRYAGAYGHGTAPGAFNILFRKPWAKYLSSFSIMAVSFISFYYLYLESILLGYAWFSLTGILTDMAANEQSRDFFNMYLGFDERLYILGIPSAFFFLAITIALNVGVLALGVSGGIEKVAKILMPLLLILGVVLLVRVLTLPNAIQGLAFMWNPDLSKLFDPSTWIAAAGQVFFTLSIGMGVIINYASYTKRNEDITLSALSANATNTFAEVIIGGSIIIPAAAAVLGSAGLQQVAEGGTFGLGFITMPAMLVSFPFSQFFAIVWFFLLFFAGITSSLSMFQPMISFCRDELRFSKTTSLTLITVIGTVMSVYVALDSSLTRLDEIDFWGSNLFLLLFGFIEVILFATHIDSKKGWLELHRGAKVQIPIFYRYILKYVTPVVLAVILISWLITNGPARFSMEAYGDKKDIALVTRWLLLFIAIGINLLIAYAWKSQKLDERINLKVEDSIHD